METLYPNPMVAQVRSIPDLLRSVTESYHAAIRATVDSHLCCSLEKIFLTGCGDSHHAALGCELAFEHLTGLSTEALTSLQLARYSVETIPDPAATLIVGISVSGEVSRTLEALLQGRKAGARLLAMTATPASRIARAAEIVVDTTQTPYQDPPGMIVPGVRSYVANQIGLLLMAVHIGETRGHISQAEAQNCRNEIADLADTAMQTIEANDQLAKEIAQRWEDASELVFLGSGPNLASACFAAAKVLEASGDPAMGQDLEEWAHLQYFARAVNTPTFIISAGERDLSRAIEVAEAARAIGRRVAVIAPATSEALIEKAEVQLPLVGQVREIFSPVVSAIPAMLFAAYRAEVIAEPYFRNFEGGRSKEGGGGISRIRTSQTLGLDRLDPGGES